MLVIVAVSQMILAKTTSLSPWKGGGFGMFATTDGMAFRNVRVFVDRPDASEELAITPSLEDAASRARLFPSDRLLARLGQAVIARERRHGRELNTVRLEVWRTEFSSPSLTAVEKPMRTLTIYVDPASDNAY
jgi:hypothetical protein